MKSYLERIWSGMFTKEGDGYYMTCNSHSEYEAIPELDVYEKEGIDDEEEDNELSTEARLSAEREMRRRDRMMGLSQGRMRHGLLYGEPVCTQYTMQYIHDIMQYVTGFEKTSLPFTFNFMIPQLTVSINYMLFML